ncbi:hypothetical protein [Nostoc sp. DedQUE07]|uniref:hypothetical protein n=1 Tax=Nostoc sp. DedQUE07 TaxID=3075392 RepID=UPI002AD3CA43|nr:hypothetical protein [Nostoc sp. DedQUE07]MDZ8131995.1 hypothetical protein [Nostoc sp. DedQUE07]
MTIECPWCDQAIEDGELEPEFEFKLTSSWNHAGACCNLCDAEVLETCQLEKRGDEEEEDYYY